MGRITQAPPSRRSRFTLAFMAIVALVLGSVVFVAPAALAHTADIKASTDCVNGSYITTYTLTLSNVPSGATAIVEARTGTTSFQSGWSKSTWSDWSTKASNVPSTQKTVTWTTTLPGTTKGNGPWEYAVTTWSNGHTVKSDTRAEGLKGDCKPPFNWDWTYPAPTCDGVTISFPADLPAGQQGIMEVNVTGGSISGMQYKLEGDAYKAKYPNGHAGLTVFIPWSEFRNYSIPATGKWTVTQLQVHGTNYHWSGELECGKDVRKVTPKLEFTPGSCTAPGFVIATDTDDYTWSVSGPESARVYTASPKGDVELTQTVFGPYDLRQLSPENPVCPPIVTPADPKVQITSQCLTTGGASASVTPSNPFTPAPNTVGTPASFLIVVDGEAQGIVQVQPNQVVPPIVYTFGEDTGDHVVEVFSNGELIGSVKVGTSCNDTVVTPVTPSFIQPTCDKPGKLVVPDQPKGVEFTVDGLTVTFTPATGYAFPAGTQLEYSFTEVFPKNCDKVVTPVTPTFKQPTCTTSGSPLVPKQPEGVDYKIDGNTVTFTPQAGYAFPAGTQVKYSFTEVKPTNCAKPQLAQTGSSLNVLWLGAAGLALIGGLLMVMRTRRANS